MGGIMLARFVSAADLLQRGRLQPSLCKRRSAVPLAASAPRRKAVVVAVVDDAGCELDLPSRGDVSITWLHREGVDDIEALLPDAVAAMTFPEGSFDVFVHGEAAEVRAVRKHLLAERGVSSDRASISPYWRRTYTDEAWREIKRDWVADQANDV